MSDIRQGDFVTVRVACNVPYSHATGRRTLQVGEQLLVHNVNGAYIEARVAGSNLLTVPDSAVAKETRAIGECPPDGIDAEDPRIAWIFEDAARMADRLGLCKDYDRLADAIKVPGRVRPFTLKFDNGDGIEISAKVQARSRRQAEAKLQSMQALPQLASVKAIGQ